MKLLLCILYKLMVEVTLQRVESHSVKTLHSCLKQIFFAVQRMKTTDGSSEASLSSATSASSSSTSSLVMILGLLPLVATVIFQFKNTLVVSICLSVLAGFLTFITIPHVKDVFIKHGRSGKDLLKPNSPVM